MKKEKGFLRTVELKRRKHAPTVISLFSGCGGMDLGFRFAGFEIRAMLEWDKGACDTLRLNWIKPKGYKKPKVIKRAKRLYPGDDWSNKTPHDWYQKRDPAILEVDITKISTAEILKAADLLVGECDVVTGGFPCQGFSTARGKRYIDDPRNVLYKECVRVVREALPQSFCFENVKGLTSIDGGRVMKQICEDLAALGYTVSWDVHDAADYGVPQHRERVIILGKRRDIFAADFARPKANPSLHLAAMPGEITYPEWYRKRYKELFTL